MRSALNPEYEVPPTNTQTKLSVTKIFLAGIVGSASEFGLRRVCQGILP